MSYIFSIYNMLGKQQVSQLHELPGKQQVSFLNDGAEVVGDGADIATSWKAAGGLCKG
jgi:hypothetical protein